MARIAARDGVAVIVATPHWNAASNSLSFEEIAERVRLLQDRLDSESIPVAVRPGAEVALVPELVDAAENGRLPRLGGSQFVLVEAPPYTTWEMMRHILFELQLRGVQVVLAHPERAGPVLEDYSRAEELRAGGVRLQVVAADLVRRWSNSVGRLARRLIRDGLADLLASDAHDARRQVPRLQHVRRMVDRLGGRGTFERLTRDAPAAILGMQA